MADKPIQQPPAVSESVGAPLPAPPVDPKGTHDDSRDAKETRRLEKIGVKSDDGQVRGQNVVADAPHNTNLLNVPRGEDLEAGIYEDGESVYVVNSHGDTIPAVGIRAPVTKGPPPAVLPFGGPVMLPPSSEPVKK